MKIRIATENDIDTLYWIAAAMGQTHEARYFERCLLEQKHGSRIVFVAEEADSTVGYVQLNFTPVYNMFKRLGIPEIQDLNVVPQSRRHGVGAALVDHCEAAARDFGKKEVGISVGLHSYYGAAQRLYVRKGYLPDGLGAAYDDETVTMGDIRPVDDLLTLKLVKTL